MPPRFSSGLLVISVGRSVQIVAGLLAVRLFTSFLSNAEVGNLYLVNSLAAFFGFALLNPVGMYIHRKLNRWINDKVLLDRFFLYNVYIAAVALLSLPVVFLLNRYAGVGGGGNAGQLLLYVVIYLYVNTWNQTIVATFNLTEHRISFVGYTVATTILGLVLSTLLVLWSQSAIWWLTGQVAAQVLVTLVAFIHLRRLLGERVDIGRVREEISGHNFNQVMKFVVPLSATTLLLWTQSQSYRVIIENRNGLEFLGQIGLGLSIAANIAAAVESIVHQTYMPAFYREINSSNPDIRTAVCNRLFQMTIPIYLGLSIFVSCLAPFLVSILAHGKFSGAYLYVIFGAWIEFFRMITGILSTAAHSEMKTGYLVKAYLVGGIIAIAGVVSATFSSRFDVLIPSALVLSGIVTMLVMYRQMHRIIHVKVGIRAIVKAGLLSLPFAGALLFHGRRESIVVSLLITGLFGAYLLVSQYMIFQRFRRSAGYLEMAASAGQGNP